MDLAYGGLEIIAVTKKYFMSKNLFRIALLVAAVTVALPTAFATSYSLGTSFSGTAPAGSGPWANVTFTDTGAGQVTVTFTNMLSGSENVSDWFFNVADQFVGSLSFGSETKVGTFTSPTIAQSLNNLGADGGGYYDVDLGFGTGGVPSVVFGVGESLSYIITSSVNGLDASDFDQLASPHGGNGVYYSAAHVQNTPNGGSGSAWIGADSADGPNVPEGGATMMLLGIALTGVGLLRRFVFA
jgi:hypothetical protein